MTLPINALDAPLGEAHMARQKSIACLLVARLHTNSESYKAALALDVRLIETDTALQAANHNARKETK